MDDHVRILIILLHFQALLVEYMIRKELVQHGERTAPLKTKLTSVKK